MASASVHLGVLVIAEDPARADLGAIEVVASRAAAAGHRVIAQEAVADTEGVIRAQLARWIENPELDVVIVLSGESEMLPRALAPLLTRVLPGSSSVEAMLCGTTILFVVPGPVGPALEKVILAQLDPATKPRNLVDQIARLRGKPADAVPVTVTVEKTQGGSGLPARMPALPPSGGAQPKVGANVVSRHKVPDDPATKPIDVARLERQLAKSTTPSHDDVTRPAISLVLPKLPPGATEDDDEDNDETLDTDDDHTATDTVAVQPAPPLPPPRAPIPSVVKPYARTSATATPAGAVPVVSARGPNVAPPSAASRESKPFSFSTPLRGGSPGGAPPSRSDGTAKPPREPTSSGTPAYSARESKSAGPSPAPSPSAGAPATNQSVAATAPHSSPPPPPTQSAAAATQSHSHPLPPSQQRNTQPLPPPAPSQSAAAAAPSTNQSAAATAPHSTPPQSQSHSQPLQRNTPLVPQSPSQPPQPQSPPQSQPPQRNTPQALPPPPSQSAAAAAPSRNQSVAATVPHSSPPPPPSQSATGATQSHSQPLPPQRNTPLQSPPAPPPSQSATGATQSHSQPLPPPHSSPPQRNTPQALPPPPQSAAAASPPQSHSQPVPPQRNAPPPSPPAAGTMAPPREPTASGTPAYPARSSSGSTPPPMREPWAAKSTSSGTPAYPATSSPPHPPPPKTAASQPTVEEVDPDDSWTGTLEAAKAGAEAKDALDAKRAATARAEADARTAADARDAAARAEVARVEAERAETAARDAAARADLAARDAVALKLAAEREAAAAAKSREERPTPPPTAAELPFAASVEAPRVRPPTPAPPAPVRAASVGDNDLPRGAFTYPSQPKRSNLVLKIVVALGVTVLGFFAVVYFLDKKSEPSTKVATGKPTTPNDAPPDVPPDVPALEPAPDAAVEPEIDMDTGTPPPTTGSAGSAGSAATSRPPTPRPATGSASTGTRPRPTPPTPPTPRPATGSATTPPPTPPDQPDEADLCDEANCVLSDYDRPCCAKYKAKGPVISNRINGVPTSLDRSMVRAGMDGIKPRVIACGEKSGVKGTVKIAVTVSPEGAVTSADVQDAPDDGLGKCVAGALRAAKFGKSVEGGNFTYPFVF